MIAASNPESAIPAYANEAFNYDKLGNRTQDSSGLYLYDPKKIEIQEDYKYIYAHDANGNLISKQEKGFTGNFTNYTYSSENQLIKIEEFELNNLIKEIDYTYDAIGRRVEKKVNGSFTRRYAYDGQEIIAEYNENNQILAKYTHSSLRTDDVLSVDVTNDGVSNGIATQSGSYNYLKDSLGSIVSIQRGSALVQSYTYSSYGKLLKISDNLGNDITANPVLNTSYSYTNREYDEESGLYYYRARYYNAETGRFLQQDPHPGLTDVPLTLINSFIYVLNNPVLNTDPKGEILPVLAIAFLVGGGINALTSKNGKPWYQNFLIGGLISVGSVFVGAAGGAIGASIATSMGGSAVLGSTIGGAVAGGLFSFGVQKIMNPNAPTNWLSVGFGAFSGGLSGYLGAVGVGQAGQSLDTFNKSIVGGLIDSVPPTVTPPPPTPPTYVPGPM
ncbi:MAG: hypothetical protein JNM93_00210 [Bacteriovoracaceae bacterium]|nr:hypothetical protein [Bacteriovoracaceae bacterium]